MGIIVGVVGGLVCGLTTLIPGWGVGLACWLSMLIPGSSLYALLSGLIISSVMEARSTNQDTFGAMFNSKLLVNSELLTNSMLVWKIMVFIGGLVIGLVMPPVLGGSMFITNLMLVVVLYSCTADVRGDRMSYVWRGVAWLAIVQGLMLLLDAIGVAYPILVIGLLLYIVPNGLMVSGSGSGSGGVISSNGEDFVVNPMTLLVGLLGSIGTIGISPGTVIRAIGHKDSLISNYMAVIVSAVGIEAIALGQALRGGDLIGKAMTSVYVNSASIGYGAILAGIAVVCISAGLAYVINQRYRGIYDPFVSASVGCCGVILLTGIWGLVLIPLGLGLSVVYSKLRLPAEAQGLTYVALIL